MIHGAAVGHMTGDLHVFGEMDADSHYSTCTSCQLCCLRLLLAYVVAAPPPSPLQITIPPTPHPPGLGVEEVEKGREREEMICSQTRDVKRIFKNH